MYEDFPKKYSWGLDSYAKLWAQGPFMPDIPAGKENRAARMKRNAAQKKASMTKFVKKFPKIKIIHKRPGWD